MKNKLNIIFVLFLGLISLISFTSCKDNNNDENIIQYQVAFSSNGEIDIVYVKEGEKVQRPSDPIQTGFDFAGWYLGDDLFDFSTPIKSDLVLVADWTAAAIMYNVTFNIDGERTVTQVEQDGKIAKPSDPVKEGYEFKGWYYQDSLWDFKYNIVEKNIELVAKFANVTDYVDVKLDIEGEIKTIKVQKNGYIDESNNPTKEYFDFKGWYYNDQLWNIKTNKVASEITLVAHFELREDVFIVKFNLDGAITSIYAIKNKMIEEPATPTKEGYEFKGWFYKNLIWTFNYDTVKYDVELVAQWEAKEYKITLYDYYGVGKAFVYNCVYGEKPTKITNPEREYYQFKGYYTEANGKGEKKELGVMPAHDITYYVYWTTVVYQITYEDSGSHSNPKIYTVENDDIQLKDAYRSTQIFDGWYTDSNFTERIETINAKTPKDIKVYAKWLDIPYPTVDCVEFLYNKENQNPVLSNLKEDYYTISGDIKEISDVGEYQIKVALINGAKWVDGKTDNFIISWKITPVLVDYPTKGDDFTYDGSVKTIQLTYNLSTMLIVSGSNMETDAGEYSIEFKLNKNYAWKDGSTANYILNWHIDPVAVLKPTGTTAFVYDGSAKKVITSYDETALSIKEGTNEETNIGSFTLVFKVNKNYCWLDGTTDDYTINWVISPKGINYPTTTSSFTFDGSEKTAIITYDDTAMDIISGVTKATDANTYQIVFRLKNNYCWIDSTNADYTLTWTISPNAVNYPTCTSNFTYDGTERTAQFSYDTQAMEIVTGTLKAENAGTYEVQFRLKANCCWKNGSLEDYTLSWKIEPKTITVPTITNNMVYNGTAQTPIFDYYGNESIIASFIEDGTDATTYYSYFSINSNYKWSNGKTGKIGVSWYIGKASITRAEQNEDLYYNGNTQFPDLTVYAGDLVATYKIANEGDSNWKAGTYTALLQGTGNFTGQIYYSYVIYKRKTVITVTQPGITLSNPDKTKISFNLADCISLDNENDWYYILGSAVDNTMNPIEDYNIRINVYGGSIPIEIQSKYGDVVRGYFEFSFKIVEATNHSESEEVTIKVFVNP